MEHAAPPELIDIIAPAVPPPAPPAYGGWSMLALLLLLSIVAVIILRRRRQRARRAALRSLHKTHQALHQAHISPRAAAFAVGQALQGVPHHTDDRHLCELLDRARYASQEPAHDSALQLLHMAQAVLEVRA